jgi:parallel beta-helix repeat protein
MRYTKAAIFGLLILFTFFSLNVNCDEIDDNILYVGNSEYPESYQNITDAIAAAEPGDTITVSPGSYYENITINTPINLIGSDKNDTILEYQKDVYGILVLTDDVTISGFTIKNASIGIYARSSNTLIENNIFQNNSNAILIEDMSNNKIISNTLKSNNDGINLYNSTNNTISDNHIMEDSYFGIKLWENSSYNILSSNAITNCKRGILIQRWSNNNSIFDNNLSTMKSGYCVDLEYSFYNHIFNNTFHNWTRAITLTKCHNNTIANNTFDRNEIGIFFDDADFNDIADDNIFVENDWDIKTKSKPPTIKVPSFETSILIIIAFAILIIFFFWPKKS